MSSKTLLQFLLFHSISNIYAMKRPEPVNLKDLEESILYLSDIKSQNRQQLFVTDFMHYLPKDLLDYFLKNYFVNKFKKYGGTITSPLIKPIIKKNRHDVLEILLAFRILGMHSSECRSYLNQQYTINTTWLHTAVRYNAAQCINVLLKYDTSILNNKDSWGDTPLHVAARSRSLQSMKLLLQNNSILTDVQNIGGSTPLHQLTQEFCTHATTLSPCEHCACSIPCIQSLLEHKPDLDIKNKMRCTADEPFWCHNLQVRDMICEARKARKKKNPPVSYCIIS